MTDRSPARPSFTVVRADLAHATGDTALNGAVVAIGNFEGVHRGHRAVIEVALARGRALGGRKVAVLTFEPHPRAVFRPDEPVFRLSDEATKLRLLARTGLDGAIVMRFDAALAALSAEDFVQRILVERFAVAGVVVGFDFHFGKGRAGSPDFLAEAGRGHGFTVDIVPPFSDDGVRVSSGAIRSALVAGEVEAAAGLLGHPWFVTGEVVHGDKRGRTLGFPTANLRLDPACGLKHGVYAVRAGLGGARHDGVANFGRRPMFDSGVVLLEVFLFDFARDIYGAILDVAFIHWIRPELSFASVGDLVRRMDEDCGLARAALARAPDAFPPI
ncbi:MAG TPA: bifunctional riboflavin kinase/FAD synthetase [Xanthobacteraceae bacterium]|nr:bifunctional riboflavin kinase/FAD synthetase [Xanthobacteraceae bacterium]